MILEALLSQDSVLTGRAPNMGAGKPEGLWASEGESRGVYWQRGAAYPCRFTEMLLLESEAWKKQN